MMAHPSSQDIGLDLVGKTGTIWDIARSTCTCGWGVAGTVFVSCIIIRVSRLFLQPRDLNSVESLHGISALKGGYKTGSFRYVIMVCGEAFASEIA